MTDCRVFKKGSPNGKITVYLGRRDFVDHVSHVDPIDGVVLVDPEYLKDRKVYGHVLAAFRYGREDLDVLGETFQNRPLSAFRAQGSLGSHLNRDKIESNLSVPGMQGSHENALYKIFKTSCHLICLQVSTNIPLGPA